MWFELRPTTLDFESRHRFVNVVEIDAPASKVFPLLTGERFTEWLPDLLSWEWTSPAPRGVGSTRIVRLRSLAVKERILAWDEGRRFAFAIEAISVPLVRRMTEDMVLEPLGDARCRFRYTVQYAPSPLMRLVHPIARPIFGRMFRRAAENVARLAGARA